jgi:hypothetical protein
MLKNTTGAVGYTYVLDTEANRAVFNIPLRDVHVLWGTPTYVYTTPTSVQTGHVYTIGAQSVLEYLTNGMPGLIATRYGAGIVATSITESERFSLAVSANGDRVDQTLPFIPEKCTTNPFNTLRVFCAVPTNIDEGVFPDDWYMGTLGYSDVLWDMDIQTGSAITLLNFLTESGREMDVQKIGADKFGVKLYFINKNDNTLWLFDRSVE